MTTQPAPRYEKEIRYSPTDRDYAMYLDGELVGFARTYHEAEITLDELIHTILSHTPTATCTHELTGRDAFVNASNEVIVSCGGCHQTLNLIFCDTPAQARLIAVVAAVAPSTLPNDSTRPCEGMQHPCSNPATHTLRCPSSNDLETRVWVDLYYCNDCWEAMGDVVPVVP
jgi:hypothetical protein